MGKIAKFIGYGVIALVIIGLFMAWSEKEPVPVLLMNQSSYIATEDAAIFRFKVDEPSELRLELAVKNQAPLDVITTGGEVTQLEYLAAVGVKTVADVVSLFSPEAARNNPDFFDNPLSQQGVFEQFSSPWVTAQPGTYSIIIDNTEAFTPTRGDAPIELRLYQRPAGEAE